MRELLRCQCGVVSRAQLVDRGYCDHDLRRLVRRRELNPLWRGVFLDHTGEPTWQQRAWASVLLCRARRPGGGGEDPESSALRGHSALVAAEAAPLPRKGAPLEVVVGDGRRISTPAEIDVRRSTATLHAVQWQLGPPRVRLEEAAIDVAGRHGRMVDLVAELARVVGARRTTAGRLLACLGQQKRTARRATLQAVLTDLASGTCSALEHAYLAKVERPHGLPPPQRQVRGRSRTAVVYRDATYDGLAIELDGRAWHDSVEQRDRDADRDLIAAVQGRATVRLTWGQVFDRSCWTAAQVGLLLGVRPRRCGPACAVLDGDRSIAVTR